MGKIFVNYESFVFGNLVILELGLIEVSWVHGYYGLQQVNKLFICFDDFMLSGELFNVHQKRVHHVLFAL